MRVPVLKQGPYLVASLQDALPDKGWRQLRDDLLGSVSKHRSRGVIIDVSAMDVMDSFATRSLDGIARMLKLKGAEAVVVGVQPEVAFAMAQLGLKLASAGTALDLDAGLELLHRRTARNGA